MDDLRQDVRFAIRSFVRRPAFAVSAILSLAIGIAGTPRRLDGCNIRLIARDTVEEKVLDLQRTKRELADAILNDDREGLSRIGREELELLLG